VECDLSASWVLFIICLLTGTFPFKLWVDICLRSLPSLSNVTCVCQGPTLRQNNMLYTLIAGRKTVVKIRKWTK
jgi:hypothetical protein